jgi:hypothetical protein
MRFALLAVQHSPAAELLRASVQNLQIPHIDHAPRALSRSVSAARHILPVDNTA